MNAMVLPRTMRVASATLGLSLALVACGGSGPGPSGGGSGDGASASPRENLTVKPGEEGPWPLIAGTYRVSYKTTGCTRVAFTLTGDTGFEREKTSNLPNGVYLVTSVTAGNYTLTQTETTCTAWEATLQRISG
jgi:hypothetical protein